MASKKPCNSKKENSMFNYIKRSGQTSKDEPLTSSKPEKPVRKRNIFSLKKPTNPAAWTPPLKTTQENNNRNDSSTKEHNLPNTVSNGCLNKFEKTRSTTFNSHFASDIMDVDDSAFQERCKTPTSESNRSLRLSETPTPPKHHATNRNILNRTPEKKSPVKDKDPLKDLKLDSSLSGFLSDISGHPALNKCGNNKTETVTVEELNECRTMYIELLEKISDAFNRIPNCIKNKFPGYDSNIYSKMNHLKTKLKFVLHKKTTENTSSQSTESSLSSNSNEINSYDHMDGDKSPSLLSSQYNNFSSNRDQMKIENSFQSESIDISTPDLFSPVTNTKSDKTVYSDLASKRSLLFDAVSIRTNKINSSPDTPTKSTDTTSGAEVKGKFTFKRPSLVSADDVNKSLSNAETPSSTLERLKIMSEKLKPLPPPETPKNLPEANSSVAFQPPESSKSFLQNLNNCNGSSPSVNQSPSTDYADELDYEMPFEEDDIADIFPETSKESVLEISDSSNAQIGDKAVPVDEDGFPMYRAEDFDFDHDIDLSSADEPSGPVYNIMDQTTHEDGAAKYEGMGDFHAGTKNDGTTGEFDGLNYPHSPVMMEMLKEKFGLKSFRPNQLQVINATLLNHDCFVLMPTGGGKSLCYQLPAILTPGVTIVISPLKSLILDQVHKLLSLDIAAAHLSGDISKTDCDDIYYKLAKQEPELKLLYVTPEKVNGSTKLKSVLAALYQRDKLARFVVDEAHCVSAWGHDFRPDYKQLRQLRALHPRVPLLALTATAAPRVRLDILHQLQIKEADCKWFLSSFNRANLVYRVLEKKPKSVNQEIAKIIKEKFFNDSGIVYCFSRKECETLATDLRKVGIQAAPYHAGLADKKREALQAGWVADKHKVICATIAFGMGVDKADVRYVIHHSMPRSLEGYYQETGRAGRDGLLASCLLYYSYRDVWRYRRMLDGEHHTPAEVRRVNTENLLRMVELCESVTDCRRTQVLGYLGERFPPELCKKNKQTACDNCLNEQAYKAVDVTAECKEIVRGVRSMSGAVTLLQLADALRGSAQKRLATLLDSPLHGRCKSWPRGDAQRLLRQLVVRGVLAERLVINNDVPSAYLTLGPQVHKLMSQNARVVFPMRCERAASLLPAPAPAAPAGSSIQARIKNIEDRCYADIVDACREMGSERGASLAAVLPQAAQRALAARLPESAPDMLALPHVTRANYHKYGPRLLAITSAYALEKMVLLMEYQDELEQSSKKQQEAEDRDTDWGGLAREAEAGTSGGAARGRSRGRKTYRGGVRKKYKRKETASSAKKKAYRGAMKGGRGGFTSASKKSTPTTTGKTLGTMPLPRPNTRPGVFKPSNLKF